jgi:hypothetical protein
MPDPGAWSTEDQCKLTCGADDDNAPAPTPPPPTPPPAGEMWWCDYSSGAPQCAQNPNGYLSKSDCATHCKAAVDLNSTTTNNSTNGSA